MDKERSSSQPVDAVQYKLGMRTLAAAVNIITSTHSGHRYGMTATAVCSVTADPPTLLVCINKTTTTHNAISKAGVFCVNTLRAEDSELSTAFSGAQSGEGRFKSRDWTHLTTGSPVLIDAISNRTIPTLTPTRISATTNTLWSRRSMYSNTTVHARSEIKAVTANPK